MTTPRTTGNRGGVIGNAIFLFLLKRFGLRPAYFLLRFVSFYFIPFAPRATRSIYQFYRLHLKYGVLKSCIAVYRNYNQLGESILDKVALLSGAETDFSFSVDGQEHLEFLTNQNGGLLLSGHVGNWEMAGQLLSSLSSSLPVSILLYQADHDRVQSFLDKSVDEARSFSIIPIKEGSMEHIFAMSQRLSEGGLLCFHIDRAIQDSKKVDSILLGSPIELPAGPYHLAAQFGVPIVFVFALKNGYKNYQIYLSEPVTVLRSRDKAVQAEEIEKAAFIFSSLLEKVIKKHPYQWFNYFDFWKKST